MDLHVNLNCTLLLDCMKTYLTSKRFNAYMELFYMFIKLKEFVKKSFTYSTEIRHNSNMYVHVNLNSTFLLDCTLYDKLYINSDQCQYGTFPYVYLEYRVCKKIFNIIDSNKAQPLHDCSSASESIFFWIVNDLILYIIRYNACLKLFICLFK